ncbi:putative alpha/beta superfamily hydrolase protein [Janthinobacterium sp. HH01]|uniref:alpha/beta fold hydrolase n=1 Tax=Janthinobacterium sp. HH01 TaxID=1198452 RepID=UPI0002AED843|nr:alpha/beta hydrolase [Janthinobacterium sp. HH01]ELX12664.1 putative alpha/beta superfamily hydrolase protein [Janthinobacterium sp. HH01]
MRISRLLLSLVLVVAFSGCSTLNVSSRQFIPKDTGKLTLLKKSAPDYQVDNIEFKHPDGAISRGVYIHKPDAQFTVLYFMGSGIRLDVAGGYFAKPFTELNANIISYDYHDFGHSDAPESAFGLAELEKETLALYDHARATTKGRLVVHGHSFGSFVAAGLAGKRPLDALVLEGTGTSARDYVENQVPWFAKPFVQINIDPELSSTDNRSALRAFQGPLLIMNGVNDVQTPLANSRELFDSLVIPRKRFEAIREAGHMNAMTKPEALSAYRDFIGVVQ